ncbi:MAG: FRG domain-containing protein, partial [Planctomycetes bacterium]|nr:FRG domain-containing protein [Planctomycetota bacterium]
GGGPMEDPAAGRHRALGAESDTDKQAAAGVNGPQAAAGVPRPIKTPAKYIAPTGEGSSGCLQSWFFNDLLGEREILHEGVQALVVMQHYGVPTRLLDWTASPWIALYFACESSPSEDGRVLRLCRSALQHNVGERFADETNAHANGPNGEIRMFTDSFVSSASDWVVCYHRHAEQFPRLVAQQGLFTIASKPMLDHWLVANSLVAPRLNAEFIIPAMLKRSVMQMLEMAGITHASLFPGVEGVAGYLKRSARYELSLT